LCYLGEGVTELLARNRTSSAKQRGAQDQQPSHAV
jgi:hypothetical protein